MATGNSQEPRAQPQETAREEADSAIGNGRCKRLENEANKASKKVGRAADFKPRRRCHL
ncbi:UNVERIFIED_CONTAM: hypothetical protein Slati_2791500 [Sesamum latifolium]|uniref:Uncharacterized protein n=1 Tax=Sesamum latifolium TaxID=2727402 RepID=A0AAW2VYU2_9LAMI